MNSLVRLSIRASSNARLFLEEILPESGYAVAGWEDAETGDERLDLFFSNLREAEEAKPRIRTLLAAYDPNAECLFECRPLPPEDWAESWKRFFKTERISSRLQIRPSWEPPKRLEPNTVEILLDPGMSFGTGRHPTTRACLRFLDTLALTHPFSDPPSFLDAGCGSGILAIAAAHLGFHPIFALDLDPTAITTAKENARLNQVADRIIFQVGDIRSFQPPVAFHAVAANLETPLLIEAADRIAMLPAPLPGASLFLAGVASRDWESVAATYSTLGFVEKTREVSDGWTSGWTERLP